LAALPMLLGRCGGAAEAVPQAPPSSEGEAGASASPASAGSTQLSSSADGLSSAELAAASCDALGRLLLERIETGFENSDKSCSEDADCVFTSPDIGCRRGCSGFLVARAEQTQTRRTVEAEIAPICQELGPRCPIGEPGCNLERSITPECHQGTCRVFDGAGVSCEDLATLAYEHGRELADAADRRCQNDGDCALLYWPSTCLITDDGLVGVASSELARLTQTLGRAGAKYCNVYWERPCPEPTRPGDFNAPAGEPYAGCVAGQCEVFYNLDR
jgi:hypothetical protein